MLAKFGIIFEQGGAHLLSGRTPHPSKSQGQHELSIAGGQVDLSRAGKVAVFRALVLPLHLKVFGEILPSVRSPTQPTRHLLPRPAPAQTHTPLTPLPAQHR